MVCDSASSVSLPVKNQAYSRAPNILKCAHNSTDNRKNPEEEKKRKKSRKKRKKKETPSKLLKAYAPYVDVRQNDYIKDIYSPGSYGLTPFIL